MPGQYQGAEQPQGPGLFGGFQPQPPTQPGFGGGFGPPSGSGQFDPATPALGQPAARKPRWWRRKSVIGGIVALALIVVAVVVVRGRLQGGSSDPGCRAYASTALPAYNNAIEVLNNSHAAQDRIGADMTTAINDLASAAKQAQSASARSALGTMLTELTTVRADVKAGSVPSSVVSALNADSSAADAACA